MPTTPYAKVLVSVNGGGPSSVSVEVPPGATIQLYAESIVGWLRARWELLDFPESFSTPAGWTLGADGVIYSLDITPPEFTLPNVAGWGKWSVRLIINEQIDESIKVLQDGKLFDDQMIISMLHTSGLRDTAALEKGQFTTSLTRIKGWLRDYQRNLRVIAAAIAAGLGGGMADEGAAIKIGQSVHPSIDLDNGGDIIRTIIVEQTGPAEVTTATLGGFAAPVDGRSRHVTVINATSGTVFIKHEDTVNIGNAVNRIDLGGSDLELAPNEAAHFGYDYELHRWRRAPSMAAGGSASAVGPATNVQTTDGSGNFVAPTNVKAGTNYVAVGASPSTTGNFRVPFSGALTTYLGNKNSLGEDRGLLSFAGDDNAFHVGSYGSYDGWFSGLSAVLNASVQATINIAASIKQVFGGTYAQSAQPRVGYGAPYASDGETSVNNAAPYTLLASDYMFFGIKLGHSGGGTYLFPLPATAGATYYKWVENNGPVSKVVSNGGATSFTIPSGTRRYLKFSTEGVFASDIGAGGGAAAVGPANNVQTTDGSGNFVAPTNVTAGPNWIGIGSSSVANDGLIRLGYSPSYKSIVNDKNVSGTTRNVIGSDDTKIQTGNYGERDLFCGGISINEDASLQHLIYVGHVLKNLVGSNQQQSAVPRIGYLAPYAVEGDVDCGIAGPYTVAVDYYIFHGVILSHPGGGTFTFPLPTGPLNAYFKVIENAGAATKTLANGGATTTTIAAGVRQLFKFTSGGVFPVGAGGSGASVGAAGQVDVADGGGGWQVASNLVAGTSFLAIGNGINAPATAGNLRLSYHATGQYLIMIKDSTGVDRNVLFSAGNTLTFGDYDAHGLTLNGTVCAIQSADGSISMNCEGATKQFITSDFIATAVPRIGSNAPYASDGKVSIATTANTYSLAPSEYGMAMIDFTANIVSTYRDVYLPNPLSESNVYRKWIKAPANTNGTDKILRVNAGTGVYSITSPGWHELIISPNSVEPLDKPRVMNIDPSEIGNLGVGIKYRDKAGITRLKALRGGDGIIITADEANGVLVIKQAATPSTPGTTADAGYNLT